MYLRDFPHILNKYLQVLILLFALPACTLQASLDKLANLSSEIIAPDGDNGGDNEYSSAKLQYSFNGPILSQVIDGKTAYIAGSFNSIGKVHNSFYTLNANQISEKYNITIDGPVYISETDTQGRIYLYGAFTKINNTTRRGLARLNPDGTFDSSFPDMEILGLTSTHNGSLPSGGYDLKIIGNTAYIIGEFTSIKGTARRGGASINLATNALGDWNPQFIHSELQSLVLLDTQNIGVTDVSYIDNLFDGVGYIDTGGNFQEFSPNLTTLFPNFSPTMSRMDSSGRMYLFSKDSYIRLLPNGSYDSAFGMKTVTQGNTNGEHITAPILYGNDFLVFTYDGVTNFSYDVKRYSLSTGSLQSTATFFYRQNCSGGSTVVSTLDIVADPINNRFYLSSNCTIEITENSVMTTRPYGFAAFDYNGTNITLNAFNPTQIQYDTSGADALVNGMKIFDGILYINHWYNAIVGYDLATLNQTFTLDRSVSWPVKFAVSSQGLFVLNTTGGSPSHSLLYAFNNKTGVSVTGTVDPTNSYANVTNYYGNVYAVGDKVLLTQNTFSGSSNGSINNNFHVFHLDGTSTSVPTPNIATGSICDFGDDSPAGLCSYGKNLGGSSAHGLYAYNTVTKTRNTSRDAILTNINSSYHVIKAYSDDEYEAYVIRAPYGYTPGVWANYSPAYLRLYVYRKGENTPAYGKKISESNSRISFARHGNKLIISGLPYIADTTWDHNSNYTNCTGTCTDLDGLTALDIDSGNVISGYGAGLPVGSSDNYNHYYRYNINLANNYLYVCKDNDTNTQWIYDATTGTQVTGSSFEILNSASCGGRTTLANGELFVSSNASIFYDQTPTGPVVAVDMETGTIEDLGFDGTVTAFNSIANELYIAGDNITTALGHPITSGSPALLSVKKADRSLQEINISSFSTVLTTINFIEGNSSKIAVASNNGVTFFNRNSQAQLTPLTKVFGTSSGFTDLKVISGQLYFIGDLQTVVGGTLPSVSEESYPSAGNLFRIDLSDLSGHTIADVLTPSTYGSMVQLPPRLKVIENELYALGLENVNGSSLQSIAKINPSTGVVDGTFKPYIRLSFSGIDLNSLVIDLVKTPSGSLEVIGLFEADYQGTLLSTAASLNPTTGAINGATTLPIPPTNLASIDFYNIIYSTNNTPLIFRRNPSTSVSTFSIY